VRLTKVQLDGLYFFLIGSAVFVLLGFTLQRTVPLSDQSMGDFRVVYFPARCLVEGYDPYSQASVQDVYRESLPGQTAEPTTSRLIYPPTLFALMAPISLLPWSAACAVWNILTFGSMIFASYLIWSIGNDISPVLAGALIGFLLANSFTLAILTNSSAVATAFCLIGTWCFIKDKNIPLGVLCLAFSLLARPQTGGLIWLYFLLAGGVYRKRALQVLLVVGLLGIPTVLWVWHISPNWLRELKSNLALMSVHGAISDPGPASLGKYNLVVFLNLQAVVSEFRDDPHFYNLVSYAIVAPLLVIWGYFSIKAKKTARNLWLGIATITPLSLLPLYHHVYDAKILLLTVPACALLRTEGRKVLPGLTILAFVLTGDVPLVIFRRILQNLQVPVLEVFPIPLTLLALGIGYLWVYACVEKESSLPWIRGSRYGRAINKQKDNGSDLPPKDSTS
jgi:Glycosyltransferase family 87